MTVPSVPQLQAPPSTFWQLLDFATPAQIDAAYDWIMVELRALAYTVRDRVVAARAEDQPTYNEFVATAWEADLWWTICHLPSLQKGVLLPPLPGTGRKRATSAVSANLFQAVRKAIPVEELAARFTALKPAGPGKLKGSCPLHEERTPSFFVFQDSQRWHCFGACARGGDVAELARSLMDLGKLR